MKFIFLAIAFLQGLMATFVLYAIQLIVDALSNGFSWPFSVWWGMIVMLPGVAMAVFSARNKL